MKIWNGSLTYLSCKACMLHHNNHALAKQHGSLEANAHFAFTKYLVQSISISWTWSFSLNVFTWQWLVSMFWISTHAKEVSFVKCRTNFLFCVLMTTCFSMFSMSQNCIVDDYLWTNDVIPSCCQMSTKIQTFNRLKTRHGLEVSSFVPMLVTYG